MLTKPALASLAATLSPTATPAAIQTCVGFVLAESRGHWHNRARAMMCRRLKHCPLTDTQRRQLVECITRRLATGNFTEQFRDQLRLALHLDPHVTREVATQCLTNNKDYIRRLATWVVQHKERPV